MSNKIDDTVEKTDTDIKSVNKRDIKGDHILFSNLENRFLIPVVVYHKMIMKYNINTFHNWAYLRTIQLNDYTIRPKTSQALNSYNALNNYYENLMQKWIFTIDLPHCCDNDVEYVDALKLSLRECAENKDFPS